MVALRMGRMASIDEPPTISEIMYKAIADRAFPGGAVTFGSCTVPSYYRAYGTYTFESTLQVSPESMWDVASLTKIMVTTPSVMLLYDRGLIELEEAACKYLPEFGNNGKQLVTIHQLLTHTAGLREFYPFFDMGLTDRQQVLDYILNDKLWYTAGEMARYSDLSMIVLGLIVEKISGLPLDIFAEEEIFEPLGMRHTTFRPIEYSDFDLMVVPTEVDHLHRNRLLWGEVHDPTAFLLGGVAGHAGLFSSIVDVCRFAQVMLAGGMDLITNRRLFEESTVQLFITPDLQTVTNPRPFALGWDVASRRSVDGYTSAGQFLGPHTFGHTGFTGTSLWIDPDRDLFVALLTNAVHPSAVTGFGSRVRVVRPLIADAAVYTMEQQANPRGSLRWHVKASNTDSRYLSNTHAGVVMYSTQHRGITGSQHFSSAIMSPTHVGEISKQILERHEHQIQSKCPSSSKESVHCELQSVAVSASCLGFDRNTSNHETPKRTRLTVWLPVLIFSLVFSLLS